MAKLVIIAEDRLRELVEGAVRQAVSEILSEATSIDVPVPATPSSRSDPGRGVERASTPGLAAASEDSRARVEPPARNGKQYVIGRANGQYSYADVVAIEVPTPVFSIDDAWDAIKDKIDTESARARGSTRRSLDTDDRFERVPDRKEIWYRRTDMEQLTMDE